MAGILSGQRATEVAQALLPVPLAFWFMVPISTGQGQDRSADLLLQVRGFSALPALGRAPSLSRWRVGIEYGETASYANFQYQALARVTLLLIGRTRFSSPFLNPCLQVGHFGGQGANDLALRLDAPRSFVITATPYSPTANRASHYRARFGALAPRKRGFGFSKRTSGESGDALL